MLRPMATVSRNSSSCAGPDRPAVDRRRHHLRRCRPSPSRSGGRSGAAQGAGGETRELTDLCLFTEARYTRHPSQADLHSAFQDHPLALEHFPTGSLIVPPAGIARAYEKLDRKAEVPD
ncbi:MAG: hypothetical protein MZW92_64010 [Comamonadaceae bacterium]|nr:hypothetical protein [Comamonadaceae bacterium]